MIRLRASRILTFAIIAACDRGASARRIDDESLRRADQDTANWLTYGRTYSEQRFSPLRAIADSNVARLGLLWSKELGTTRGLEATPLVLDGVLYTTGSWSVVYAIDARTGKLLWTYDPQVNRKRARIYCCDVVNRGVAIYKGRVYVGTLDGRLVAIDAKSGARVWETQTTDSTKPYSITGAPRVAHGLVLIGNGGAEMGVRGYVSAYDADKGTLAWRTYTVPGDPSRGFESEAMRTAASTWKGRWWEGGGGGTPWDAIVYDPELDVVYVGTGNGSPWYRALRSPGGGDNLYLSSIIALRASDGKQLWYFQTTPGDNWDFTATAPLMLADLDIGGRRRKVIMQAPKNGFFYVLDRETGAFISAKAFSNISWATGVDSLGRPLESPSAVDGVKPTLVSPDPSGAHSWHPMAFNPGTGLVYFPVRDATWFLHRPDSTWRPATTKRNEGVDRAYDGQMIQTLRSKPAPIGRLIAWDPVRQETRWHIDLPVLMGGGVVTTAGNLVFEGRADGRLTAYRATDGAKLWEFDAGTGVMAPPVTYLVDGVQYLTVMVGWGGDMGMVNPPGLGPVKPGFGRILTFALGGNMPFHYASLTRNTTPIVQQGAPAASPAKVAEGRVLYETHCIFCHGVNAIASSLPDLRYASPEVHRDFESIVLRGARERAGMPSFGDLLNASQVQAIRAYVLQRARESVQR